MPKNSIDHCKDCGIRLKNTKHIRTRPMSCPDCVQRINPSLREICKDLKKKNENMPDEDWSVLNCPKAMNEVEYGRVVKRSNASARETTLSEIII